MILLLGSTGYIGSAFKSALIDRNENFTSLSHIECSSFKFLYNYLEKNRPSFIINAAGYTGKPNVDACEIDKVGTLRGNVVFPQILSQACSLLNIPWGHVSSGCIFAGCQVNISNEWIIEKDMTLSYIRNLAKYSPEKLRGFTEDISPNFSFNTPPCSFYSGTKALSEEIIQDNGNCYIWRLRIPFDEFDNNRNYLSKIQRYSKVYDNLNSLSHRSDFVNACLDSWLHKIPFGIYNITNPGFISTENVVEMIKIILKPKREFIYWENDKEFYTSDAIAPRSNCIMDSSKIINTGVKLRSVESALEDSLLSWVNEL